MSIRKRRRFKIYRKREIFNVPYYWNTVHSKLSFKKIGFMKFLDEKLENCFFAFHADDNLLSFIKVNNRYRIVLYERQIDRFLSFK
jgi:hypothetical protein